MSYIYDYCYWEDCNNNTINDVFIDRLSHKNIEQQRYSDSIETEQLLQMLNNEDYSTIPLK